MAKSGNGKSNGHGGNSLLKREDGKVRVAIIGVGNCASSLVQGVHYYRDAPEDKLSPV